MRGAFYIYGMSCLVSFDVLAVGARMKRADGWLGDLQDIVMEHFAMVQVPSNEMPSTLM